MGPTNGEPDPLRVSKQRDLSNDSQTANTGIPGLLHIRSRIQRSTIETISAASEVATPLPASPGPASRPAPGSKHEGDLPSLALSAPQPSPHSTAVDIKGELKRYHHIVFDIRRDPDGSEEATFNLLLQQGTQEKQAHDRIETRANRSGVAGAYLTALELINKHGYWGRITMLADDKGRGDLAELVGADRENLSRFAEGRIQVVDEQKLRSMPAVDLYVNLGRAAPVVPEELPFRAHADTVYLAQTIFGYVDEDFLTEFPHGMLKLDGQDFKLDLAGVGPRGMGIYPNIDADRLRSADEQTRREHLLQSLEKYPDQAEAEFFRKLAAQRLFRGSKLGFFQAFPADLVARQFEAALRSLVAEAARTGATYCVVLSGWNHVKLLASLPDDLKDSVQHLYANASAAAPETAAPGTVYAVLTNHLTEPVRTGLMALSDIPAMVSTDDAISSAIRLGIPFFPGVSGYNIKTNWAIQDALRALIPSEEGKTLIDQVFGTQGGEKDFLALWRHADAFAGMAPLIPELLESMVSAIRLARDVKASPASFAVSKVLAAPASPLLKVQLLSEMAMAGNSDAITQLLEWAYPPATGTDPENSAAWKTTMRGLINANGLDTPTLRRIGQNVARLMVQIQPLRVEGKVYVRWSDLLAETGSRAYGHIVNELVWMAGHSPNADRALSVLAELQAISPEAIDVAMKTIHGAASRRHPDAMIDAAIALLGESGKLAGPEHVQELIRIATDKRTAQHLYPALAALAKLWTPEARRFIFDLYHREQASVKTAIVDNIGQRLTSQAHPEKDVEALRFLVWALNDEDSWVRNEAAEMIGDFVKRERLPIQVRSKDARLQSALNELSLQPGQRKQGALSQFRSRIAARAKVTFTLLDSDPVKPSPSANCERRFRIVTATDRHE